MTRSKRYSNLRFSRLAAGILLAFLAPALAAESPPQEPEAVAPVQPGWRAYIDPATGELTSSPRREQVEALNKSLARRLVRTTEGLETFELRRGGHGVYLAGRFQSALMVKLDENGELLPLCVADPDHAAETLSTAAPAAPPAKSQWAEK